MGKPKDGQSWESWIDGQIQEAAARGAFEDLPGRGRPLDLSSNPYALDQELAFKILKDAGCAPEWIELDKAIRNRVERARLSLSRSRAWRDIRLAELGGQTDSWANTERARIMAAWREAIAAFEREIDGANHQIRELNLKVPSSRFQRSRLDALQELARMEEAAL
jgi:DnaJ homolog subfamily C member 28